MEQHVLLLLLLLLSATALSPTQYQSIVKNVMVYYQNSVLPADSHCVCRNMCDVLPSCMAASYASDTSECYLMEGARGPVYVKWQDGVVTFSKYQLVRMFLTEEMTHNGALENQRKMCVSEGGWLVEIIATENDHNHAKNLIAKGGYEYNKERYAYMPAYDTHNNKSLFWPNGSAVSPTLFEQFGTLGDGGPASVLGEFGKLHFISQRSFYNYPVLCYGYPTEF